jgi:hypothetical protein
VTEFGELRRVTFPGDDVPHNQLPGNPAVNNLTLMFAEQLVANGFATWKPGWDRDKLNQATHD